MSSGAAVKAGWQKGRLADFSATISTGPFGSLLTLDLATYGGLASLILRPYCPRIARAAGRRIANPPQIANLPHN
jgi:hypothetical protein